MKFTISNKIIALIILFAISVGIGYGATKMMNSNIHYNKVQEMTKRR